MYSFTPSMLEIAADSNNSAVVAICIVMTFIALLLLTLLIKVQRKYAALRNEKAKQAEDVAAAQSASVAAPASVAPAAVQPSKVAAPASVAPAAVQPAKVAAPVPVAPVAVQPAKAAPVPFVDPVKNAPAPKVEAGIPGRIVAAITAAVECFGQGKYSLCSVARASRPVSGRESWSRAGRIANTEPF